MKYNGFVFLIPTIYLYRQTHQIRRPIDYHNNITLAKKKKHKIF